MFVDLLIIFIMLTIIMFIFSIILIEEYTEYALLMMMAGILFAVIVSYGFIQVEYMYSGFNATSGNMEAHVYVTEGYSDPYPIAFLMMVFFFVALFVKAVFNYWKKSAESVEIPNYQKRR